MIVAATIEECRRRLRELAAGPGAQIGLVPTMGALHEGHLSLVRRARTECDVVAISIFVNPTQFGPAEDLDKYPRPFEQDCAKAAEAGAELVFAPTAEEMYPDGFATSVHVRGLTEGLCGAHRPGHFDGVCAVVAKLFEIVGPQRAYFGEKDYQQLRVIQRMTADLNLSVEIVACPTVRDADGLAVSSRNAYLSAPQRKTAARIPASLRSVREAYACGARSVGALIDLVRSGLGEDELLKMEYAVLVDPETLAQETEARDASRLMLAVRVGDTRLIDNVSLGLPEMEL